MTQFVPERPPAINRPQYADDQAFILKGGRDFFTVWAADYVEAQTLLVHYLRPR